MRLLAIAAVAVMIASPATSQNRIVAMTNGSGVIATGGSSQQVFGQNDGRNYLFCQNPLDATEALYLNFGASATIGGSSIELAPGGSISFLAAATPIMTVNVTAVTTGHRFICKQGGNN